MKGKWLFTLLSGIGAGLYPMLCSALGLGDIQVESRLNQPLRARIEVVGVTEEEWTRIHASIAAQSLSSEDSAHPELLESVTLHPIEDANHKRFIEVKSGSILTEPLFDLPVEVSGDSAHVVRTYPVLLDPEGTSEGSQSVVTSSVTYNSTDTSAVSNAAAMLAKADAAPRKASSAEHRASRRALSRSVKHARSRTHAPTVPTAPATPGQINGTESERSKDAALKDSAQDQIPRELAMLRQMLSQMQATIATQDAQIAKLAQRLAEGVSVPKVATRTSQKTTDAVAAAGAARSLASRPAATVAHAAASAGSADNITDAPEPQTSFWRPAFFYWTAGGVAVAAALAAAIVASVRRRKANASMDASAKVDLSFGNRPFIREALSDEPVATAPARAFAPSGQAAPPSERIEGLDSKTNYHVEEHAGEPEVSAEPTATDARGESDGLESWHTQTALLEQDILAATSSLPFVMESLNQVNPALTETKPQAISDEQTLELQRTLDSLERQQSDHSTGNQDIVRTLQNTLDIEPDRVDVQLKLLEIYHHEALGNRENFHSLLGKLKVDQGELSSAQRSHLEMLRRTLEDDKLDMDSNFPAKAAM